MITLVLGGTRSGKSEVAEALAARLAVAAEAGPAGSGAAAAPPVTYVATGTATDAEMAERIAAHRSRRPASWATVEAGTDLPAVLSRVPGPVLLDSLGTWVAAHPDLSPDAGSLCRALAARTAATIVVSEEVGLGVHPPTEAGRRFADALGTLNRQVAAAADEVLLVVAGRTLPLAPPP